MLDYVCKHQLDLSPPDQKATKVLLCLCAWMRSVNIIIEQPPSSLMNYFSPMKELIEACLPHKIMTYLGCFGARTPKPVCLYSTCADILCLARPPPRHMSERLTTRQGSRVNGNATALRCSQSYPKKFGRAVALVVKKRLKVKSRSVFFE